MRTRMRVLALAMAAVAGLGLAGGLASAGPASGATPQVARTDFWFLHSTYDTQRQCETAAQQYLWPANPTGADGYRCKENAGRWELWLGFLS